MIRRRHFTEPESHAWGETLQRAMIDLFLLLLLVMVVRQPMFGVNGVKLPDLVGEKGGEEDGAGAQSVNEIRLKTDGAIVWKDAIIPQKGAAERIAAEAGPGEPIVLIIETTNAGEGALQAFLQLQLDCSKAGIWNRVCVLSQPTGRDGDKQHTEGSQP